MKYIVETLTICSSCHESIEPGQDISNPSDWTYTERDSSTPFNKIICPRCCGDNATEKYYEELVRAGFCHAEGRPLPPIPDLRHDPEFDKQVILGFFYELAGKENHKLVDLMLDRWTEFTR